MTVEDRIRARIEQLKASREELIRQLFGFDAAIGELEAMLRPEPVTEQERAD